MLRRTLPLCFAGILVACGGSSISEVEPAAASPTDTDQPAITEPPTDQIAPPSVAPTVPAVAPDTDPDLFVPDALKFSAPLIGGGEIELGALAGRPVLLWFWAPW